MRSEPGSIEEPFALWSVTDFALLRSWVKNERNWSWSSSQVCWTEWTTTCWPESWCPWRWRSRWSRGWRREPSTTGYHSCPRETAKLPVKISSGKPSHPANSANLLTGSSIWTPTSFSSSEPPSDMNCVHLHCTYHRHCCGKKAYRGLYWCSQFVKDTDDYIYLFIDRPTYYLIIYFLVCWTSQTNKAWWSDLLFDKGCLILCGQPSPPKTH